MTYTPQETAEIHAAGQAKAELRMVEEAFDGLRADLVREMLATAFDDAKGRENAFHAIRALDLVRQVLLMRVAGADVAQHNAMIRKILDGDEAV